MKLGSLMGSLMAGLLLTGVLVLGAVPAHAQNLVQNSSFETGDFTNWTIGDPSDPFTFVTNDPGFGGSGAQDGAYYAALGTIGGDNTVSQAIGTTIGDTYQLSFYLASDGLTPNDFSYSFGTANNSYTDIPFEGYQLITDTFVATGASTNLIFTARDDPGYLSLDNVSVVDLTAPQVPEPSSLAVFTVAGLGLCGLLLVARRRRALSVG